MKKRKELIRSKSKRLDNKDLIKAKLIKVYPFNIDELLEENTRGQFQEMYTQLNTQYAWQMVKIYEQEDLEGFK